jgi:hypothetical protein
VFYADEGLEEGSCRMYSRLNETSAPLSKTIEIIKGKKIMHYLKKNSMV